MVDVMAFSMESDLEILKVQAMVCAKVFSKGIVMAVWKETHLAFCLGDSMVGGMVF